MATDYQNIITLEPDGVCYPVLNVLTKTGVVLGIGILIRTLHIGLVWTP